MRGFEEISIKHIDPWLLRGAFVIFVIHAFLIWGGVTKLNNTNIVEDKKKFYKDIGISIISLSSIIMFSILVGLANHIFNKSWIYSSYITVGIVSAGAVLIIINFLLLMSE
jgi:magnesium-transporting ATPase (P-type)